MMKENQVEELLTRLSYRFSDTIYKVLYDKYRRPLVYETVRQCSFFDREWNDEMLKILNLSDFTEQKLDVFADQEDLGVRKFEELRLVRLFEKSCKENLICFNLCIFALMQQSIFKIIDYCQFDKKIFIFVDNNRLLHNKLIYSIGMVTNMQKFSSQVSLGIFGCAAFFLLSRHFFQNVVDCSKLRSQYRRQIALYNKIKI